MESETIRAYGPGRRFFLVDEDQLRELIINLSPEIRHNVEHIADAIRESVNFERQKAGLDDPRGKLSLETNKDKKAEAEPDLVGQGYVAGRYYHAVGWLANDKITVSLLPPKHK